MKRRKFIQLSTTSIVGILSGCSFSSQEFDFEIEVRSDDKVGHILMSSQRYPIKEAGKVETIIVGGGVAGLTSAYQLKESSFKLFELSDRFGGSSSAENYNNTTFAQGAHYDMVYPQKFGREVLKLLSEIGVVYQEGAFFHFRDKEYLIPQDLLTTCKVNENYYSEVLFEKDISKKFYNEIAPYYTSITLPSRLSEEETKKLNSITFLKWLEERKIPLSTTFLDGVNYHLIDDYGAGADKISAFAGIAYYAVRPEIGSCCSTFSPPQGNYYFIEKLLRFLPDNNLHLNHLVKSIKKKEDGYAVEVIDVKTKTINTYLSDKIVYAGQKNTLKYILEKEDVPSISIEQAPWMVVNLVLKKENIIPFGSWQNEDISDQSNFMGFVDSSTQYTQEQRHRVLTVYYCFSSDERHLLKNIKTQKNQLITEVVNKVANFFQIENEAVISQIEKVYINLLGHGMPIPIPEYLFQDLNENRKYPTMVYAGVDNGRLPFLIEAMDSAVQAVKHLQTI